MTLPSRNEQLQLAELAGRAPSPHNIQPARWRFTEGQAGGKIELHECTRRWLRVGDPSGRDNQIALGAAWEGMCLALSEHGYGVSEVNPLDGSPIPPDTVEHRLIASADLCACENVDLLAPYVRDRKSFRGVFLSANEAQRQLLAGLAGNSGFALGIVEPAAIKQIATWYDQAAALGLHDPLFVRELYSWMRFSASDPDWSRDGLSTECMGLSPLESFAARFALKPMVVRGLSALKLESVLVSEAAKVNSAAMLMLLYAPVNESAFVTGRKFYRFWLQLTSAGFCGVPMSALADSAAHAARLVASHPLPSGQHLVNVMRVGPQPSKPIARSARLPAAELLLP